MKYCKNCGTQLNDDALHCPNCGSSCQPLNQYAQNNYQQPYQPITTKSNYWAIAGFVSSFFYPILGIILSGIGLHNVKHTNKGKAFAIAGIIIGIILIVYELYDLYTLY